MKRVSVFVIAAVLLSACRPSPASTVERTQTPAPRASPVTVEATPSVRRYSDAYLGFAVEYPADWEVTLFSERDQLGFPPEQPRAAVQFMSNLYAGGEQVFGRYMVTVAVGELQWGTTVTETVEYYLTVVIPTLKVERRYGLVVGGEPAIELTGGFLERWGCRRILVAHAGWEYWLSFRPSMGLNTPADIAAQAAFDAFLRSFTFIPITVSPTPTITPVPTPTS